MVISGHIQNVILRLIHGLYIKRIKHTKYVKVSYLSYIYTIRMKVIVKFVHQKTRKNMLLT